MKKDLYNNKIYIKPLKGYLMFKVAFVILFPEMCDTV